MCPSGASKRLLCSCLCSNELVVVGPSGWQSKTDGPEESDWANRSFHASWIIQLTGRPDDRQSLYSGRQLADSVSVDACEPQANIVTVAVSARLRLPRTAVTMTTTSLSCSGSDTCVKLEVSFYENDDVKICVKLCIRRTPSYSSFMYKTARWIAFYTVSQKSIPDIFDCNLKTNYQISIVFATNISDTTCHQMNI